MPVPVGRADDAFLECNLRFPPKPAVCFFGTQALGRNFIPLDIHHVGSDRYAKDFADSGNQLADGVYMPRAEIERFTASNIDLLH